MPRQRHIGINAVFLRPKMGGMTAYVRYLIPELIALRPDWRFTLFVNGEGCDYLAAEPWSQTVTFATYPLLGARYLTALSETTLLTHLANKRRIDLLHSLAMTGPLVLKAPHIVTVPDLIWLHEHGSTGRATNLIWRTLVPLVARRADRVITISDASRRDIADNFKVRTEMIDVTLLGPGEAPAADPTPEGELRNHYHLGNGPIVFTTAARRAYKNPMRLLQAMEPVSKRFPDVMLVIPGTSSEYEQALKETAARLGITANVSFPSFLSTQDLEAFYRCANCFVYPSLREGFGLPVLEAMRRDVPVACSNISSLPEVAGDAARYFDPYSSSDIASAVLELLADPHLRARLITAGRTQSERFTWRKTAEATIASYERAWTSNGQ